MSKKKISKNIIIAVLVVVFGLGLGFTSMANVSLKQMIADKAGAILGASLADKLGIDISVEDENLGGSGGVFQTDWYKVGNRVTWIKSGQFADKSINLMSFLNPVDDGKATSTDATYNMLTHYVSTSTVASLNIDITGVSTSTFDLICGGATTATAAPTYELFNARVPTSTETVLNNNQTTTTDGIGAIGTGSATQILLTHDYPYFNCVATGTPADGVDWGSDAATGGKGGVTGDSNTFDGYWSVEIIKNLQ